jgi:very-short-patch-repair endonuclease
MARAPAKTSHTSTRTARTLRSAYLQRGGYPVLRCWNDDVLQRTEAVLEQIEQESERTRQKQR